MIQTDLNFSDLLQDSLQGLEFPSVVTLLTSEKFFQNPSAKHLAGGFIYIFF